MRKLILSAVICLALAVSAQTPHYIVIKGNVGSSSLQYDMDNADFKSGLGYGGEISYRYFFNDNWGFGSGLAFSALTNTVSFDEFSRTSGNYTDTDGDDYALHLFLNNWEEEQKVSVAEIPIIASYKKALKGNEKLQIYAEAGLKVMLPISATYSTTSGAFQTKGYYDAYHVMLSDIPDRYVTDPNYRPSGDITLNTAFAFTADAGLLYDINDNWSLFGGVLFDYGLNDIKKDDGILIAANDQSKVNYTGVANSNQVSSIKPINIKVEFGVRFRIPKAKPKETPPAVVEPVVIPEPVVVPEPVVEEPVVVEPVAVEPVVEEKPVVVEPELKVEEKKTITPVTYGLGQYEVSDNAKEMLEHFAQMMKDHPEYSYTIVGHTCSLGDSIVNINAGMARARNFRKALGELGVDVSSVKIESKGENEPLFPNDKEENRKKNRRVEVVVEKP